MFILLGQYPELGVRLGAKIIEIHEIWSFTSRNSVLMEVEIIKIQSESAIVEGQISQKLVYYGSNMGFNSGKTGSQYGL